jgi:hypothetical protein
MKKITKLLTILVAISATLFLVFTLLVGCGGGSGGSGGTAASPTPSSSPAYSPTPTPNTPSTSQNFPETPGDNWTFGSNKMQIAGSETFNSQACQYMNQNTGGTEGNTAALVRSSRVPDNTPMRIYFYSDSTGVYLAGMKAWVSGTEVTITPSEMLKMYPGEILNGTTWGASNVTVAYSSTVGFSNNEILQNLTYTCTASGPETVTVPAGTFDDVYKVAITGSSTLMSGTNSFSVEVWVKKGVGVIQTKTSEGIYTKLNSYGVW